MLDLVSRPETDVQERHAVTKIANDVDAPPKGRLLTVSFLTKCFRVTSAPWKLPLPDKESPLTSAAAELPSGIARKLTRVTERFEAFRRTKLYDLLAAAPIIAWFVYSAAQALPLLSQRIKLVTLFVRTDPSVLPATLVFRTVSEVATLAFFALSIVLYVLRYIPQRTAPGFFPRFAAMAGTFSSLGFLLLSPQELSSALYLVSLLLLLAGIVFSIFALLVLGRSISLLPQARRLVTRGPYALVRHPLYLGEMAAVAGIALQHWSIWALLLLGVSWVFQFQRMKYEERVLSESFPEYKEYMARTARLVPGVY